MRFCIQHPKLLPLQEEHIQKAETIGKNEFEVFQFKIHTTSHIETLVIITIPKHAHVFVTKYKQVAHCIIAPPCSSP